MGSYALNHQLKPKGKLMNEIATKTSTDIQSFTPEEVVLKVNQAESAIHYGERTGNIELVENAIEALCDQRFMFLEWWGDRRGRPEKGHGSGTISEYGLTKQNLDRWRKKHGNAEQNEQTKESLKEKSRRIIDGTTSIQGRKKEADEWYTPSQYIEKARNAMGGIDLDPASCHDAQQTIRAKQYFTYKTEDDNGLTRPWAGNVWINPPFTEVLAFADKLISHLEAADVDQAIVLTNNNTDTLWWHKMAELANGVCFTKGRISFYNSAGEAKGNTNGQCFFYFGEDNTKFISEFYDIGLIL